MRSYLDFYETPPWYVDALLEHAPAPIEGTVLDLTAGRSAVAAALSRRRPDLVIKTNDLDPGYLTHYHFDATNLAEYPVESADWVITNPPYYCATAIVRAALEFARTGVALLLGANWDELCRSRYGLLTAPNAPSIINISRRYCWRKSKKGAWQTPPSVNRWFVWDKRIRNSEMRLIPTPYDLPGYTYTPDQTLELYPGFPWTEDFYAGRSLESDRPTIGASNPFVADHCG